MGERTEAVVKGSKGHCALAGDVTKGFIEDSFWCPVPMALFHFRNQPIPIFSPCGSLVLTLSPALGRGTGPNASSDRLKDKQIPSPGNES